MTNKKSKKSEHKRTPNRATSLIVAIAAIALALIALCLLGIYVLKSTNYVFRSLSRVVPFPAALVNNDFVSYFDYADNVVTMRRYLENQEQVVATEDEIRAKVMERLVANAILNQMAEERDIKVFDYEIEKAFKQAIEGAGVEDDVKDDIKKSFGWDIEEYKAKVVRPFVLQNKLTEAIYDGQDDAASQFGIYLQEEINTAKVIYFVPH